MKLLLDTHILIWYFDGDRRLSTKARETIDDNRNENFFSSLAIFEVNLKLMKRPDKIPIVAEKLAKLCLDNGFKCLPVELKHVEAIKTLKRKEGKPPHKDPFDNLMLAQAVAEEMLFITHDEHIAEYDCENIFKV